MTGKKDDAAKKAADERLGRRRAEKQARLKTGKAQPLYPNGKPKGK